MLYHEKNCTIHNYATQPNTLYMSQFCFIKKHALFGNITLKPQTFFMSPLFYTTKHTLRITIKLYHKINTLYINVTPYHETYFK